MRRNERLLMFGRWTSKIGDIIFDYANSVILVSNFTNNSWVFAIYQSSQKIISVMFNLIGGAISDVREKKKILIMTDFLSALVCIGASVFVDSELVAIALILVNGLLAFIFSFSSPTFKSIVRDMVSVERITAYNSISNGGCELIGVIGPIISLALVHVIGANGLISIFIFKYC